MILVSRDQAIADGHVKPSAGERIRRLMGINNRRRRGSRVRRIRRTVRRLGLRGYTTSSKVPSGPLIVPVAVASPASVQAAVGGHKVGGSAIEGSATGAPAVLSSVVTSAALLPGAVSFDVALPDVKATDRTNSGNQLLERFRRLRIVSKTPDARAKPKTGESSKTDKLLESLHKLPGLGKKTRKTRGEIEAMFGSEIVETRQPEIPLLLGSMAQTGQSSKAPQTAQAPRTRLLGESLTTPQTGESSRTPQMGQSSRTPQMQSEVPLLGPESTAQTGESSSAPLLGATSKTPQTRDSMRAAQTGGSSRTQQTGNSSKKGDGLNRQFSWQRPSDFDDDSNRQGTWDTSRLLRGDSARTPQTKAAPRTPQAKDSSRIPQAGESSRIPQAGEPSGKPLDLKPLDPNLLTALQREEFSRMTPLQREELSGTPQTVESSTGLRPSGRSESANRQGTGETASLLVEALHSWQSSVPPQTGKSPRTPQTGESPVPPQTGDSSVPPQRGKSPRTPQIGESSKTGESSNRQFPWDTPQISINDSMIYPARSSRRETRSSEHSSMSVNHPSVESDSSESTMLGQVLDLDEDEIYKEDEPLEPGSWQFRQKSSSPIAEALRGNQKCAMPAAGTASGSGTKDNWLPLLEAVTLRATTRARGPTHEHSSARTISVGRSAATPVVPAIRPTVASRTGDTRGSTFLPLTAPAASGTARAFPMVPTTVLPGSGSTSQFPSVPTTELGEGSSAGQTRSPTLDDTESEYSDAEERVKDKGKGKGLEFA